MTPEDLARAKAFLTGYACLGDWHTYAEWLWVYDLPSEEADLARFEELHRAALEELHGSR